MEQVVPAQAAEVPAELRAPTVRMLEGGPRRDRSKHGATTRTANGDERSRSRDAGRSRSPMGAA
jgi:hypothetical protein